MGHEYASLTGYIFVFRARHERQDVVNILTVTGAKEEANERQYFGVISQGLNAI